MPATTHPVISALTDCLQPLVRLARLFSPRHALFGFVRPVLWSGQRQTQLFL
jgi:hypothetical protein